MTIGNQATHSSERDPKGVDVFRPKKLPLLPVILSQPFSRNNRQYSVVGQSVSPFPFITYFDVYDEEGNRANEADGRMVYKTISKLEIASGLEQFPIIFESMEEMAVNDVKEELGSTLSHVEKQRILTLYEESPRLRESILSLLEEVNAVHALDELTEEQLGSFRAKWSDFWNHYEGRLDTLFHLRDHLIKEKRIAQLEGTALVPIYVEAEMMWGLFVESIPMKHSLIKNIDDLTEIHYELGRVKQAGLTRKLFSSFELSSNTLFEKITKALLWIGLPVTIILALFGMETFRLPLTAGAFLLFFYYVYQSDTNNMLANVEKRVNDHRLEHVEQLPIIEQKYKTAYRTMQEDAKRQQVIEEVETFRTNLVRPGRWSLGIGLFIAFIGFGLYSGDTDSQVYGIGYFVVGAILITLRFLLPHWSIAQRTFECHHDKLVVGRRTYYIEQISSLQLTRRRKIIKLSTTLNPQVIPFSIKKEDRSQAAAILEQWCMLHDVQLKK